MLEPLDRVGQRRERLRQDCQPLLPQCGKASPTAAHTGALGSGPHHGPRIRSPAAGAGEPFGHGPHARAVGPDGIRAGYLWEAAFYPSPRQTNPEASAEANPRRRTSSDDLLVATKPSYGSIVGSQVSLADAWVSPTTWPVPGKRRSRLSGGTWPCGGGAARTTSCLRGVLQSARPTGRCHAPA